MADLKPSNNTGITLTSDEIDQEKVRKYLEQEEKPTRTLGRFWGTIVALIAVAWPVFIFTLLERCRRRCSGSVVSM